MLRCEPLAFAPRSSVTFGAEPLVQAIVTEPLPLRSELALATTGSYGPKATALVLIVQLAATEAETVRFAGWLPATAGPPSEATPMPNIEASAIEVARLLKPIVFMTVPSLYELYLGSAGSRLPPAHHLPKLLIRR